MKFWDWIFEQNNAKLSKLHIAKQEEDLASIHGQQYMQTNSILEKVKGLQKDFYIAPWKPGYLKEFLAIQAYTLAI